MDERMTDERVILEKLESLRRCVRRVEAKCPDQVEALLDDWDRQDILTLNLTRAVQLCVDIAAHLIASGETAPPDTMAGAFEAMHRAGLLSAALAGRMKGAVGFRNVAIHNYREIDWRIVHSICREHLGDFQAFARAVLQVIEPLEGGNAT